MQYNERKIPSSSFPLDPMRLVRASTLSTGDPFFKDYTPKTTDEENFKREVAKVINAGGVKDFFCPIYDPSFDEDGLICFKPFRRMAICHSIEKWEKEAEKVGCRLGTYSEYIAFLAVFIKEAPDYGKSYDWAWNAVCNVFKEELGHYPDSSNAKPEKKLTGSREVCGWYNLGTVRKFLAKGELTDSCFVAGGHCQLQGSEFSLARVHKLSLECVFIWSFRSTGWLVASSF